MIDRAQRAVGEIEIADAGGLLEAERHLEAAALHPRTLRRSSSSGRRPSTRRTAISRSAPRALRLIDFALDLPVEVLAELALQADAQGAEVEGRPRRPRDRSSRQSNCTRPLSSMLKSSPNTIVGRSSQTNPRLSWAAAGAAAKQCEDRDDERTLHAIRSPGSCVAAAPAFTLSC